MQKGWLRKKGERDAQGLHQFLSTRNKKHCVRELELVSAMRNQADFSHWYS